tara:strand:+ start:2901 stop:3257 length:357 start_codon:yes stop_codon:yes gene_type:complete
VNIFIDGGTRGSRICLVDGDKTIVHVRKTKTGDTPTNNELEYLALEYALQYIKNNHKGKSIKIYSDSKLIVNQMNGDWRVTTDSLIPLYNKCKAKMTDDIKLRWVSRKFNLAGHVLED